MDREMVAALAREAAAHDERRVLVLAGEGGHFEAAAEALSAAEAAVDGSGVDVSETTLVGPDPGLDCEHLEPARSGELLGTTRAAIVLDCRTACRPTDLGRVVGAVDGGGLLVLLTPPLDSWATRRDGFDETLAVPPDGIDHVTGHFRDRLVETLRAHRGIAIADLDAGTVRRDGLTGEAPRLPSDPVTPPADPTSVPRAIYDACLTQDQVEAVSTLSALDSGPTAAVLEADRGRGKSSVAGLLAARFAANGDHVVVTGPDRRSATALFERVLEVLPEIDGIAATDGSPPARVDATGGGSVEFVAATTVRDALDAADVLFVEEAAALPVGVLEATLAVDRVAYTTTVHGYEGSGRGFAVRFRDSLEGARHEVIEQSLTEPIRYAAGDPVEVWASRALLLGASPVPDQVVADATPDSVTVRALDGATLRRNETRLRSVFGLLVTAHYRTEPDDLARMLDGSNLTVRALLHEGHVVAVALLGREGGLPNATRAAVTKGQRIRGNMLPDVLMSQLRDEPAGRPIGVRVVRIATHPGVRSRGLGSTLLAAVEAEFGSVVDWLGSGFGATPDLVSFWQDAGYAPVHLSTGRNPRSGEHSVLMVKPTSEAGAAVLDHHSRWFATRIRGVLGDALRDLDPAVVAATLRAVPTPPPLSLTGHQWRVIADAAFGPGLYSVDPEPFRELVVHALIDEAVTLAADDRRLLVRGLLQHHPWDRVAEAAGLTSRSAALRAVGRALQPLVDQYRPTRARRARDRYGD
jgi:tRNA(Met) cytidine acetyltransferase